MAESNTQKKTQSSKNQSIREQLFSDTSEGQAVTKTLSNGIEVEMKEPSKGQRNRIVNEARTGEEGADFNPLDFMLRIAVECAYVPGKNAKIFHNGDYDKICELHGADWVDELVDMAREVVGVTRESMEKN